MNKFIVLVAILFATAAAEDGYTCFDTDSIWTEVPLSSEDITSADECKAACDTAVEAGATEANDWCCVAIDVTDPVTLVCNIFNIATDGLDIRFEPPAEDGVTYSAWAWEAGVASDDLNPVEETPADDDEEATEEDEDLSVRMTASALAAASIAMIAM